MHIRCWGSRGSVPVSGTQFTRHGGDTTCLEIRPKSGETIIVDAGTGIRRLGRQLVKDGRNEYHLIFTHAHLDHIMGFPFFRPLFTRKARFRMYRPPLSAFVEPMLSNIMIPPFFPIRYRDVPAHIEYAQETDGLDRFEIGSVTIEPIPLSHPNTGRGFKFTEDGRAFVFLTDNELHFDHPDRIPYRKYVEFAAGADLLVHDAEYTPAEYPAVTSFGHSTYIQALELALEAGVKKLGLFHLNQDRSDQAMTEILNHCHTLINENGRPLECFAVRSDMEFEL